MRTHWYTSLSCALVARNSGSFWYVWFSNGRVVRLLLIPSLPTFHNHFGNRDSFMRWKRANHVSRDIIPNYVVPVLLSLSFADLWYLSLRALTLSYSYKASYCVQFNFMLLKRLYRVIFTRHNLIKIMSHTFQVLSNSIYSMKLIWLY